MSKKNLKERIARAKETANNKVKLELKKIETEKEKLERYIDKGLVKLFPRLDNLIVDFAGRHCHKIQIRYDIQGAAFILHGENAIVDENIFGKLNDVTLKVESEISSLYIQYTYEGSYKTKTVNVNTGETVQDILLLKVYDYLLKESINCERTFCTKLITINL